MDVVFLVDSSSSVNEDRFVEVLQFVSEVIGQFNTIGGEYGAQFGMVQFSYYPQPLFYMTGYNNKTLMMDHVLRAKHMRGATNTGKAIPYAHHRMFSRVAVSKEQFPPLSPISRIFCNHKSRKYGNYYSSWLNICINYIACSTVILLYCIGIGTYAM